MLEKFFKRRNFFGSLDGSNPPGWIWKFCYIQFPSPFLHFSLPKGAVQEEESETLEVT